MDASREELSRISGPSSMSHPAQSGDSNTAARDHAPSSAPPPDGSASQNGTAPPKKKRHRGGRKHRKTRRQSFIAPSEATDDTEGERPSLMDVSRPSQQSSFYRLQSGKGSNTSLESEALLDHREQAPLRARRSSVHHGFARSSIVAHQRQQQQRDSPSGRNRNPTISRARVQEYRVSEDDGEGQEADDRTPLLSKSHNHSRQDVTKAGTSSNYGGNYARPRPPTRRSSKDSKASTQRNIGFEIRHHKTDVEDENYDVNNPPSMPTSPKLGSLDDVMINDLSSSNERTRDAIIDIDVEEDENGFSSTSPAGMRRRPTIADIAERDVCFPGDVEMSEIGEEEDGARSPRSSRSRHKRRHRRDWPDLEILEEFSREEKEERTQEQIRAKKLVEPMMIEGRLRKSKRPFWHPEQDDAPFRFTYFNELLDGTIHARNISDLCQDGTTFRELFIPDPIELSDSSDDEDVEDMIGSGILQKESTIGLNGRLPSTRSDLHSRQASTQVGETNQKRSPAASHEATGTNTPTKQRPHPARASKRYGPRPTFWLDVYKPTEVEMKVLAKAFGIHQLTIEDILMEEPREKVELFQSYYFVNYRSFEQDENDENYLEPINIYAVVFRDGVISFHHSMTPHPANVRRRIRQLNDYMSPTADWISYAIIDDVTDVYAPLVQQIENEVDEIDDDILYMHQSSADGLLGTKAKETVQKTKSIIEKVLGGKSHTSKGGASDPDIQSNADAAKAEPDPTVSQSGGDMLRRVGECRKKVMGLYRLLGNKADVIKGFAKRCNEHWEVAPRSEIGLYLGDIQDHIVTMTGNLSHYENLLSRAHSNYLAQINIRMNERAEKTADVLGKLTVLGTIVLPMNIVTGMWGMNVWVPGQDKEDDLTWFWCITAGLVLFGITCYITAKRVYGIV